MQLLVCVLELEGGKVKGEENMEDLVVKLKEAEKRADGSGYKNGGLQASCSIRNANGARLATTSFVCRVIDDFRTVQEKL